jgi:DNA-3-methyladenine glycosylase I
VDALARLNLASMNQRCPWCLSDPLYIEYHDQEWGVPEWDDRRLFAKLVLDGAQAGLSWLTILRKREGYYRAFAGLDPELLAAFDDAQVARLMHDPGIVRNRLKIRSAILNARGFMALAESGTRFSEFLWRFVDGRPVVNHWQRLEQIPVETRASQAMSRELRRAGFSFVGPTICYAFMQAVGMVNDHLVSCFRHADLIS